MSASQNQQKRLQDLADKGSEEAAISLDLAQKREAEIRREKQKEIQQQKLVEAGLTAFKVYGAKTEAGDPNALGNTLTDLTTLSTFLKTLPTAFDGVVDTGKGGDVDNKGGFLSVLHPNERVVPKKDNIKMGGISNEKAADIIEMYNKGLLNEQLPQYEIKQQPFQSNTEVIAKYDEMIKAVNNMHKKMPTSSIGFDSFRGKFELKSKKGNNTTNYLFD